ncbi:MAG: hypothetical protein HRJ53_12165 [Acidobacteria bacterium Pan2503]|uniref:Uncharacterized protein n=1 Tax=Candidatus Acidiferrum panamense TaxID=2741543 RepID=A0A7V8NQR0_9BACT|nr:hypothetical protein [Candidatus Acidoferrum panamensis]
MTTVPGNTVTVPEGPNSATVKVLDGTGADITGSCTINAVSSDSTIVQIGNPDPTMPSVIPFTALVPGGSATIMYTATNSAGEIDQTDTINIQITAPASMVIVYAATLPVRAKSR